MDKRTTGIIATVATVLLCGCPGLGICLFGAITAAGQGTFNEESLSPTVGFVLLCLSLIFIAIPIVVGIFTLRKKPEDAEAEAASAAPTPASEPAAPAAPAAPAETKDEEPLPPAS